MSLVLDMPDDPRGLRRRLFLSGRHGRAAALSGHAQPTARADQGGQSRARPGRARAAVPGATGPFAALKLVGVWLLTLLAGAAVTQLIARTARPRRAARVTISPRLRRRPRRLVLRRRRRLDHRRARGLRRGRRVCRLRAAAGARLGASRGAGCGADRGGDRQRGDRRYCWSPRAPACAAAEALGRCARGRARRCGFAAACIVHAGDGGAGGDRAAAARAGADAGAAGGGAYRRDRPRQSGHRRPDGVSRDRHIAGDVVLLLALVGIWSLAPDRVWGGLPGRCASPPSANGVLAFSGTAAAADRDTRRHPHLLGRLGCSRRRIPGCDDTRRHVDSRHDGGAGRRVPTISRRWLRLLLVAGTGGVPRDRARRLRDGGRLSRLSGGSRQAADRHDRGAGDAVDRRDARSAGRRPAAAGSGRDERRDGVRVVRRRRWWASVYTA